MRYEGIGQCLDIQYDNEKNVNYANKKRGGGRSSELSVETLVVTMQQYDFSLYTKMNIQTDAIIANQSSVNNYEERLFGGNTVKMITTDDRGVGVNRNQALLKASGDILLFADDDMIYVDGYQKGILKAYEEFPDADMIIFSCVLTRNGMIYKKVINKNRRVNILNSMKYGSYVISIRRKSLLKANVHFSHIFGGGALYGSGEDSSFILDCHKRKLKVYTSDFILGSCSKDESTWFKGFGEKYFFDKGAWIACSFPRLKYLIAARMLLRLWNLSEIPKISALNFMVAGMKSFPDMIDYAAYKGK